MRIAFYVSGQATRLKLFLANPAFQLLRSTVCFVVSDNPMDAALHDACEHRGIPVFYFERPTTGVGSFNEDLSDFMLEKLTAHSVDYCFVFGGRILVGELLTRYSSRMINFHPSLLPSYKGLRAIDQALRDGAFLLGNTAHFIVEHVDSGPVVMQNIVPRLGRETTMDDVLKGQVPMLCQIIGWLEAGRLAVDGASVVIDGADYSAGEYIPRLEDIGKVAESVDGGD